MFLGTPCMIQTDILSVKFLFNRFGTFWIQLQAIALIPRYKKWSNCTFSTETDILAQTTCTFSTENRHFSIDKLYFQCRNRHYSIDKMYFQCRNRHNLDKLAFSKETHILAQTFCTFRLSTETDILVQTSCTFSAETDILVFTSCTFSTETDILVQTSCIFRLSTETDIYDRHFSLDKLAFKYRNRHLRQTFCTFSIKPDISAQSSPTFSSETEISAQNVVEFMRHLNQQIILHFSSSNNLCNEFSKSVKTLKRTNFLLNYRKFNCPLQVFS